MTLQMLSGLVLGFAIVSGFFDALASSLTEDAQKRLIRRTVHLTLLIALCVLPIGMNAQLINAELFFFAKNTTGDRASFILFAIIFVAAPWGAARAFMYAVLCIGTATSTSGRGAEQSCDHG